MKVGFSLLEETSDGVSEIPSQQEQQAEEVDVSVPVSAETSEAENNELNKIYNFPETNAVASMEDLVDLRISIEKSQGINKDFVLSLEAISPGVLAEAGLHINGFTECLSKINYNETVNLIDKQIGKSFLNYTVSQEGEAFDPALVGESVTDEMKKKWDKEKEVFKDLTNEDLMKYGKIIAYKIFHNIENGHAINQLYSTVLSGAGEIQYVNGVPALITNPAFQAPSSVSDAQPQVVNENYSEENLVFVIRYLVEEQEEKKKTKKEIAEDLIEQMNLDDHRDLERNFEVAFKDFKKDMDNLNKIKEDLDDLVDDVKWEVGWSGAKIKILNFLKAYSKKYTEYENLAEKTSATIDICLGLFYLSKNEYFGHYFSTTFLGHSMDLGWIKRDFKLPVINKSEKPWKQIAASFPETVDKFTFEKSKVLSTNFNDLYSNLKG